MIKEPLLFPYVSDYDAKTVEWLNSDALRETFGLTYRPSLTSHREWLKNQHDLHLKAIVANNQHVGNASLRVDARHNKATLEIYIGDAKFHGHGIGKRALSELLNFGFNDLDLNRIELVTRKDNKIAESLYVSMGFQLEGCERQAIKIDKGYLDQNLWSLLRSEWTDNHV